MSGLTITALLGLGAVSGFLGGMLGIGGGVVIVPGLIILFELARVYPDAQVTVIAVGTSLACIVFTSASAAITQYRAGKVRLDIARKLLIYFIIGSFLAGVVAPLLDPAAMRGGIALFLLVVAVIMLTRWQPNPGAELPGRVGSGAVGVGGGLVSGLAGIAGGNVIVPTLTYFNVPVHQATATSSAMGIFIALAGAVSYGLSPAAEAISPWQLGFIDGPSFVLVTVAAVLFAPLGVKLAHRTNAMLLRRVFACLLFVVAIRMFIGAIDLG